MWTEWLAARDAVEGVAFRPARCVINNPTHIETCMPSPWKMERGSALGKHCIVRQERRLQEDKQRPSKPTWKENNYAEEDEPIFLKLPRIERKKEMVSACLFLHTLRGPYRYAAGVNVAIVAQQSYREHSRAHQKKDHREHDVLPWRLLRHE